MWEFEFYNKKTCDYEIHYGYSPDNSIKNCAHRNDLELIRAEFID